MAAWPRGRVQRWFERNGRAWKLGDKLQGDREVWKRATRTNALFLSTAAALNSEQLQPIFDWFDRRLAIVQGGSQADVSLQRCRAGQKARILAFLREADLAIADLRVEAKALVPKLPPEGMPAEIKDRISQKPGGETRISLHLRHDAGSGQFELAWDEESDGTQKAFALAGPWLDALCNGNVTVIDDLPDNLHPVLVKYLVELFHNPKANQKCAQLIFSTHDTSILSQDVFRRDQIWFCERNRQQETRLFPLTDFHPRRNRENLERFYLEGRYGAVPYLPYSPR